MVVAVGNGLGARTAGRARRFGSIPWSAFMEAALYDPEDGFYQAGGRAGRTGDFVTSPELGSLFAAAWARALDQVWEDLRYPDPFFVVEGAAGVGTLARDILAAGPACAPALRYVLVEQSAPLRAAQAAHLPVEVPALVLGPAAAPGDDDDELRTQPGIGPLVTALAELPAVPVTGVVFANELLDNLPVDLLEYHQGRWHEVRVGAAHDAGDELAELLVPAPAALAAEAVRLAGPDVPDGARIPLARAGVEWVRQALAIVPAGRVMLVDYFDTTAALAQVPWPRWLRAFRQHQATFSPLQAPGSQDITCVVPLDQLAAARPPDDDRSQAEWLAEQKLGLLVEAARATWRERAAIGDLAALAARSRVHEAEALTDPAGLGGHRVVQWIAGRRA